MGRNSKPLSTSTFHLVFLYLKQLLRTVLPCAEMIFVKDDEIPVDLMHPLIRRLDAAGLAVIAEKILKRPEADDGFFLFAFAYCSSAVGSPGR